MPEEAVIIINYLKDASLFTISMTFIVLLWRGEFRLRREVESAEARELEWKKLYLELLNTTEKVLTLSEVKPLCST